MVSCVQVRPSQPSRQMHENESPLPTQVPPLAQGSGRQPLLLATLQVLPFQPGGQAQRKASPLS